VFAKKEADRPLSIQEKYKDTPYLNGGLFEKSELEYELEKQSIMVLFKDELIRELVLKFFENYNFTIDENSPNDQEVSIDPEMLGKVFENTLAEEERGKKGTFYTPREIVHFMVKESLWQFLVNESGVDSQKLRRFIFETKSLEEIGFKQDEIRLIDSKLEHIKVLDPAVGSAAFPVEMMQVLVKLRKQLNVNVGINVNEVELKKRFIKENLFGVDIDPGAIEVAKLRLWLSLIVDYEKSEAEPLPNLDFQFRLGNSLQEKVAGFDIISDSYLYQKTSLISQSTQTSLIPINSHEQLGFEISASSKKVAEMEKIINEYFEETREEQKKILREQFDKLEQEIFEARIHDLKKDAEEILNNSNGDSRKIKEAQKLFAKLGHLDEMVKTGVHKLFIPRLHFSEVFKSNNGFDIVIGNPPYGVKVDESIKDWHSLGSRDSYGVFISSALKRFLKPGGVLAFIVSDTWLTIKTHKRLREQVLENRLHKVIRLNQDCFDATVNACVINLTKSPGNGNRLIAADLTNISTRNEVEQLRQKMYDLENQVGNSTPKYAVYAYDQELIRINSNLPIFVGSPKLFTLMNDNDCETIAREVAGKSVLVRQIQFNDKFIDLTRFGDIADIKQGLATGDNKAYLFQNPESRGGYRSIEDHKQFLLSVRDLANIASDENLRLKVIVRGFHKSQDEPEFDEDLWFGGRYIVPYDKGGESDTDSGFLPNYYIPTNYFIDWSSWAVDRMKNLTINDRDGKGKDVRAAVIRNSEYCFRKGLSESRVGMYTPTFRIATDTIFDSGCSNIFLIVNRLHVLGILNSKLCKLMVKSNLDHTVNSQVDVIKEIPFCITENLQINSLVEKIIAKQKDNLRYDYMSNEQKEIDRLVYEMYGLNGDDIREVETWYARRYPKLARFCDIDC